MVVEVTRMPIYNNALNSVPTQYFLLFKYLIPTLFSFFFLSSIFSPLLLPFFPFVLLTALFFFLHFFFLPFFPFLFFPIIFPLRFLFLFLCLVFTWYVRPTVCNVQPLLNMEGQLYWHSESLSRALLENNC